MLLLYSLCLYQIAVFPDANYMAIFTGEYDCKMDAKGRLLLPSRIKAKLPECSRHEIVLSQGFEPCLVIYTIEEYKIVYDKVSSLSQFNLEHRKLQRNFFRGSIEVELDNMGRFLVPKRMAQYAQLRKDVLIVGTGSRLEIWNPDVYEESYTLHDPEEYSALAEKYLDNQNGGITPEGHVS